MVDFSPIAIHFAKKAAYSPSIQNSPQIFYQRSKNHREKLPQDTLKMYVLMQKKNISTEKK
jgi:hypothetical protein